MLTNPLGSLLEGSVHRPGDRVADREHGTSRF